ncbi:unnamed protein product [Mycena citricolor]|uniref:Uncharacterized protein n=1 Tax=Mycena citricolor TaxID=2018698 RepID=A0AAD2K490_9AGAR|nr:unnamed protein product [Mycena citricolor]
MSAASKSRPASQARTGTTKSVLYGPETETGFISPYALGGDAETSEALDSRSRAELGRRPLEPSSPPRDTLLNGYRSLSWLLGFRQSYSLVNGGSWHRHPRNAKRLNVPGVIWGGALIGFCLARSFTMNVSRTPSLLVPGEWFWLSAPIYKVNIFIHIYLTTIGGIFSVFQFFPAIRRKNVLLHRLNGKFLTLRVCDPAHGMPKGYGVLFCLVVGNICGAIVARRSIGGELNVQSAYYILAIMVVYSGLLGAYYVKRDTRLHRRWMLRKNGRLFFNNCHSPSHRSCCARDRDNDRHILLCGHILAPASLSLLSIFKIWRCDEIINLLELSDVQNSFPQCVAPGANASALWVAVHASTKRGPLYLASSVRATLGGHLPFVPDLLTYNLAGMCLWIATLMHMAGVEYYLYQTDASNQVRFGFVLEPLDWVEEDIKS